MAAQIMGSVGVRQAAIANDEIKFRGGKRAKMIAFNTKGTLALFILKRQRVYTPATMIQPNAMVGTTITSKPFA